LAPRSAEAHLNLGVVEVALGNSEAARREFQAVLAIDPAKGEALFNLGKLFFQKEDYVTAERFFSKFAALSPVDTNGLLHLLQCAIKTKDAGTVTKARSNLLKLAPEDAALHTHVGKWLADARDYEAAREEFDLALRLSPASDEARLQYANMCLQQGQAQKAVELLSPLTQTYEHDAFFHYLLAQCYERELDPARAYVDYEKAIEIDPNRELYYLSLASLFLSYRVTSEAERVLTIALDRFPRSVQIRVAAGLLELESGNPEDAMSDYRQAIALAPESPLAFQLLGRIQMAQGDLQEAISTFQRTVRLNPTDAQPDFLAGLAYMRLGDQPDMALKSFLLSLQLNPDSPGTYYWIGMIYLRRKHQYNLAAQYFLEALRRAPGWGAAHQSLIQCYRFLGEYTKAEEQARKYREAMRSVQPLSDLKAFLETQ
jgi:tetratricopeptide (TPR) repeat protein